MITNSIVDIRFQWPINPDRVRIGEVFGIPVCTDKATKDFVPGLHMHTPSAVVDSICDGRLAV